jgi:hypothetical protein
MAIGLFAVALYIGLLYAGFVEFKTGMSKKKVHDKRRSRSRASVRASQNTRKPDLG